MSQDDVSEFIEAQRAPASRCAICELLPEVTPEQRAKLEVAFVHPKVNSAGILAVLAAWGHVIDRKAPAKVVQNHRVNHVSR